MIGRHVSHFYIIRALGSGGMGVVYEAQDTRLPRSVALKFLKGALEGNTDAVRRFKREARLSSSLNHPNICTILDVQEGDGQPFIAMELLRGRSLKARLSGPPMEFAEVLDIGKQVASALTAAHEQGIIHRDIAPGNVFLTDSGVVKLLDFGLAKHFPRSDGEQQSTDDLTGSGAVAGTIHYMAPEQLEEAASVDYRCDLFSLGVLLYQMAAGARPFDITPRSALVAAIRSQAPLPMRSLVPDLPAGFARIVETLLSKRPEERYQSARALQEDLDRLQGHADQPSSAAAGHDSSERSIAVLPFDVLGSADATTTSFRDGLAEVIRSQLAGVPGMRVAPRTSTERAIGMSISEQASRLQVELVLEGTLQRSDQRVRVTANLIAAAGERPAAPAFRMDRPFGDLLDTQDDAGRHICEAFMPALGHARRRPANDPEASHALKRGQHSWRACFTGGWREAIQHFQYAIERDDTFAPAHVALAAAYNFLGLYCLIKPNLAFGVATKAAHRALEIDASLAAAHVELAVARFGGDWDWEGAESAFRQAIALEPGHAMARVYYSWLLILLGRDDAAYAESQRGLALAPSSRLVVTASAQTLFNGGEYAEAIRLCNQCLGMDPKYVYAVQLRGQCHLATSARASTLADLELAATLSGRAPYYLGLLGRCYGQFGMREDAVRILAELEHQPPDTYVAPQCFVYIYAGLGERKRALEYQEQAYEDGASPFNYLTPSIRDLYARDPYHHQRLMQMRLVL